MQSFRRYLLDKVLYRNSNLIKGCVLDLGGKKTNKRGDFNYKEIQNINIIYLNIDLSTTPDVIGNALQLPFMNSTFDTIIMTEVLEYVHPTEDVLNELSRVVKPAGNIIITLPFLHPLHGDSDSDYLRYTSSGIKKILGNKLSIEKIEPMGSYISVIYDILRIALGYANKADNYSVKHKIVNKFLTLIFPILVKLDNKQNIHHNEYINTGFFLHLKKHE